MTGVRKLAAVLAALLVMSCALAESVPAREARGAAFAAGVGSGFAVRPDGVLVAWGRNSFGELGDGTTVDRHSPVTVMEGVAAVASGFTQTAAVTADGELWLWGHDPRCTVPVKVKDGVRYAAVGSTLVMAIDLGNGLWVRGLAGDPAAFVHVMDGAAAVSVGSAASAGVESAMVIDTQGVLWQWADADYAAPVRIAEDVVSVSAGVGNVMFIDAAGNLWGFGSNSFGELGDGTTQPADSPVMVMEGVAAVDAGVFYTLAVRTDGSLWGWGGNWFGNLGDGTTDTAHEPVRIMDDVAAVSTHSNHTMALRTDGSLWAWGLNERGQLGDTTTAPRHSPLKIADALLRFQHARAVPTRPALTVNGEYTQLNAYNIGGSTFFRLRDIAHALRGTGASFGLGWDAEANAITITRGAEYDRTGGEPRETGSDAVVARPSPAAVNLDGEAAGLIVYHIAGYNYFKLRELGGVLGFGVDWDESSRTISITTGKGLTDPYATETDLD
ncbi:MAG: hypothetical protein FWD98_05660 [Defluviitaleaceae bacterium]|nr:hypothetical protein [Defluviitaleaceae bacterium]